MHTMYCMMPKIMYVRVLVTGNVVGANLFFAPARFWLLPHYGIGQEARTCRHMVARFSLVETRGYGSLLPTRYQVYHSTPGTRPLFYNRHAVSAHQRRVEDDWNTCRCTSCYGALAIAPRPSRTIHVYYENDTYVSTAK